jgi:hypothetical protein
VKEALLSRKVAERAPLPLTPSGLAAVGNRMMGRPYGWGCLYENRDCSSTIRDLFVPFGIWLPRNSARMGDWGRRLDVAGLSPDEKEARILASGIPFFSLVRLRGHIGLYLGGYDLDGKEAPVMFHTLWGLHLLLPGTGRDGSSPSRGRAVIGKTVVTSLRPGAELPSIDSPAGLLDRIDGLSLLPRR